MSNTYNLSSMSQQLLSSNQLLINLQSTGYDATADIRGH